MENYTSFLRLPSPTTSANSSISLSINGNSHSLSDFEGIKGNGFLGLMTGEEMNADTGLKEHKNPDQGKSFAGSAQYEVLKFSKKKGEKKVRKTRYAFQTRSHVDILDDGYRWRKYGQKAVKNNKFPRSYYRCTHQGCDVKKQVQRLTKDEAVVVTTYEGMHSHPIEKSTDNFENILSQMQIYPAF
ncbi:hypothetical protein K2173_005837 [Erythroxylum novogranatense]|uniref:WRKY domain-containing protein n=1 Tax=Erythroxylum novogranatense TaxID=1862640 RepID=A0AAV8U2T9_9ROSI|nr:hypothetical protein K2173_005837 [Erythroxylum novogranatense]